MSASLAHHYVTPNYSNHYFHHEEFRAEAARRSRPFKTYSYLHPQRPDGSFARSFHFSLEGLEEEVSSLPVRKINQFTVTFTLGTKTEPAIYYQGKLISSIAEALKNIKLPAQLDQSSLNTIATITNYIGKGTKFTYIEDSAKVKGQGIEFEVRCETVYYQANLSSLNSDCKLTYYQKNID